MTIDNLRGSGHLKRGRLRIPSLRATLATIPVTGTMVLDAKGNEARLSASMSTGQVDVAGLLAKLGSEAPVSGKINRAEATVETEGASVRDLIRKAKAAARVGTSTFEHRDGKRQFIVQRASAIAGPNLNSRAEIHGEFGEFPIELLMVGGRLSELFEARAPWPKVRAELHTIVEKQPVHVTAMSSLDPIVRGRDVPIHVSAHMEGARVVVAGTIADMEYPERAPLEASIKINSLSRLPFMLEGPALPDIPISAKARVVVDEDAISVGGLVLSSGQSNLAGEMRLVYESRPKLTANLDSKLLDLRPYIPRDAGRDTGTATARFDEPLDLKIFQGIDFDIDVRVQRFITHLLDLNQFYLKANLHDRLLRMSLSMAEGNSLVELGFNARTKRPIMAARLKTTDLDLESLKPQHVALMGTEIPLVTVNAQFSGTGMTLREVYQSAKGKLVFSSGPGKLVPSSKPFIAQAVSSDLLETLVPGRRPDDYNQLECAAAHFNVADGIAASPDGIALRFKRMDILGSGAVNLTTREIMFGFKAVRRRFFSFSILSLTSDFARISGTIDKPRVGLDTSGVFVTGGAAWATAGLSLLATNFLRTLASSENPCSAIIEKGRTAEDPVKSLMKGLHVPGVR
ncbi:MAG: hypothetical protein GTO41_12890 [Burkholderiales bacterium]|nr:hypothetical protein [Burkholderiales bacterium]